MLIYVTFMALNLRKSTIILCTRGLEWKQKILVKEEAWYGYAIYFKSYFHTLDMVSSFRYLVRILMVVEYY